MTISVKNLKKFYYAKNKISAINNISCDFSSPNVYGIAGNNGAGKTTFFMCLCGFIEYSGTITFDGEKLPKYLSKNNKSIALITNKMKLDEDFTLDYTVSFFGQLNDMSKKEIVERKIKLYKLFHLESYANRTIGALSTGLKQKALLTVSLLSDPDIIILDEPLSNIDYYSQNSLIEIIKTLKEEKKLIFISSHVPGIIEKVCTKVLFFEEGKISNILSNNEIYKLEEYYKKNKERSYEK